MRGGHSDTPETDNRSASSPTGDLGWAIIGTGHIVEAFMLDAIAAAKGSRPVALVSSRPEHAGKLARRHNVPNVYHSLDEALENRQVDVVYVASTNDLHASQTITAARAGKHVLCEKPLAPTSAEAYAMCEACERAGVVLATNHNKRESPVHRTLRSLVAAGSLGTVRAGHVRFATYLPEHQQTWRLAPSVAGGGVVMDLTVHDIDLIRYILQTEIASVAAVTAQHGLGQGTTEDSVAGVLTLESGAVITFHDTFALLSAGTAVELHGDSASVFADNVLGDLPVGEIAIRTPDGSTQLDLGPRDDMFVATVTRFNDAVRDGRAPTATGRDGARAVAVAEAALFSAANGGLAMRPADSSAQKPAPADARAAMELQAL